MNHEIMASNITKALANQDTKHAVQQLIGLRPIDIADILSLLNPAMAWQLLSNLPNRAIIFAYLEDNKQIAIAHHITGGELAQLVSQMPSDEQTDLYKNLSADEQQALLPVLAQAKREQIRRLSVYDEGTAGALMTADYAVLKVNMTVADALKALRLSAPNAETIYHAYVIDEQRILLGFLSLKTLILSSPDDVIGDIMNTTMVTCHVNEKQEQVAKAIARYDLIALPIIDEHGALVGIVTHDDAMDVARDEATEDFHRSAAVSTSGSGKLKQSNIGFLYRRRIFWLIFLVFGNLISGAGISHFEDVIATNLVLVFFLPLLVDSGGNAGSQSATLMVRALATGEVVLKDWFSLLGREALVAFMLGLTMALAVSIIGYFRGDMHVSLVLALSMISIVMIGCLIGMSLPFVLDKLGFDPASASAPLITSICDASGVLIYLFIASRFLPI